MFSMCSVIVLEIPVGLYAPKLHNLRMQSLRSSSLEMRSKNANEK